MINTILLVATLVAPVEVEFRLLPPGHMADLPGAGKARYYLLSEYLMLANFDRELYYLRQNYKDLATVNDALRIQKFLCEDKVKTLEGDKKVIEDRCSELVGCHSPWWHWAVAIGSGTVGIVGVVLAVSAALHVF